MSNKPRARLGALRAPKLGSIDPSKYPDEIFDLHSIPAFDSGAPERLLGREIGSAKQIVQSGDVLLSRIVPHIRRAWVVGARTSSRMIASNEWMVFRSDRVEPDYLRHVLVGDAFHAAFMRTVSGVGGSLLRAKSSYVSDIEISLPSLAEQRRIATLLDRADAVRQKREESRRLMDELLRSVFLEMFGDPVRNEKGWEVVRLGDVAKIQGGVQVTATRKSLPVRAPYLRVANVLRGGLDLTEVKHLGMTQAELNRTKLWAGDLLMVEGHGNPHEVGRCALWDGSITPCSHQNHLIRIRVDRTMITPEFLVEFLNSAGGSRQLHRSGKTTSGLNTISTRQVGGLAVPLPPIGEQNRFSEVVNAFNRLASRVQGAGHEMSSLGITLSAQLLWLEP